MGAGGRWDEKKSAVEERQERHGGGGCEGGVRNAVKEDKEHKIRSPFAEGDS